MGRKENFIVAFKKQLCCVRFEGRKKNEIPPGVGWMCRIEKHCRIFLFCINIAHTRYSLSSTYRHMLAHKFREK